MKVMKPMPLSVLTRCFEFRERIWMGMSALLMVPLGQAPRMLWPEKDLWQFWGLQPESQWPLEEGLPRARAEYLLCGHAYPNDDAHRARAIRARVGSLEKQLHVHGRRFWNGSQASQAQPFERLPLHWMHAWGGPACAENPLGMGMGPGQGQGMADAHQSGVRLLPNIEYPHQMVAAPSDVGTPAGFGPIDGMWPQRAAKRGTYDDAWFKQHFPGMAPDADWTAFNVASPDQQQTAPFVGDENYVFDNLHPSLPRLAGALPGLRARLFVTQSAGGAQKFKEVATALKALWFFPDQERAILVFQGMHPISQDDGADIDHLLGAIEDIGQPRSAQHYLDVRDKRLDRVNGAIESLREEDLMPADLAVPLVDFSVRESRALARGQARAQAERAGARAEVASYGLDPDVHAPPLKAHALPEVRSLDDLLRLRAEADQRMAAMKHKAEQTQALSIAEARALFVAEGKDFGLIEREMAGLETRGPPKPFVDDLLKSFHGFIANGQGIKPAVAELQEMVVDDKLHAQWRQGEAKQLMAYRLSSHCQHPVSRPQGAAANATRQKVVDRYAQGGDFRRWDLTGADLSGLDLSGADFEGVLMEGANLSGTQFTRANLRDAVLAHAELLTTQFSGAVLAGANLGAARVMKANFENADLTQTIFAKAKLDEVSWRGATLNGVRLEGAQLGAIDCAGARAEQMLSFVQLDLRGFCFARARLKQMVFVECDLRGVDFSGAVFEKCGFVTIQAAGARFCGLRIDSGCFAQGCDLSGCDFSEATLRSLSFRGAKLAGARLQGAQLGGSDFSECDLSGADLGRADAREARFVRAMLTGASLAGANLMDAVFQHAALEDTDYRHANLFQSDFARVRVAPGVRFEGALVTRMRTYPRHREGEPKGAAA